MNTVLKKIIIVPFITAITSSESCHVTEEKDWTWMTDTANEITDKLWLYFQQVRFFLSFQKCPDWLWIHSASHSLCIERFFQGEKAVEILSWTEIVFTNEYYRHPHTTVTLVPPSPSYHRHPHTSVTFVPPSPLYHRHPRTIVNLVPSSPLYHRHPRSTVTLIPPSPSYHRQPHTTVTFIPPSPSYHRQPHTTVTLIPPSPSYHRQPRTIVTLVSPSPS
jgi:hypothetical protein